MSDLTALFQEFPWLADAMILSTTSGPLARGTAADELIGELIRVPNHLLSATEEHVQEEYLKWRAPDTALGRMVGDMRMYFPGDADLVPNVGSLEEIRFQYNMQADEEEVNATTTPQH
jgi:hypothetical protein